MKILGGSFNYSLQLVYTRNVKYLSLEPSELANKLSALQWDYCIKSFEDAEKNVTNARVASHYDDSNGEELF